MRSPRHRPFALCAALALTLPSLVARAEPAAQEEAASRFKKGLDLFKEGDYQASLIELRRANELAPNFNVLYNIGQVYFQLQDYPNALRSLEIYLQEGGKGVEAKRRAEVERDIEKLRSRVANLEIEVNVPDAEVTIDEISAGKTPLPRSVLVGAGRHRITVSRPGFDTVTKVVEIASAELQKVPVELLETQTLVALPPAVAPRPAPVMAPLPPPRPPPSRTLPTLGWAVTGGLAGGAVVTGILALGASSSLKTARTSGTATRDDLEGARSKTQTLALMTDILAGVAVVTGGLSLYLTLAPISPSDARSQALMLPTPTLSVVVNPSGASLFGTF